jgi:hypothetical protein
VVRVQAPQLAVLHDLQPQKRGRQAGVGRAGHVEWGDVTGTQPA